MPFSIKKFVGLKSLTDNGIIHIIIYDCLRSFFAIKIYEFWNDQQLLDYHQVSLTTERRDRERQAKRRKRDHD